MLPLCAFVLCAVDLCMLTFCTSVTIIFSQFSRIIRDFPKLPAVQSWHFCQPLVLFNLLIYSNIFQELVCQDKYKKIKLQSETQQVMLFMFSLHARWTHLLTSHSLQNDALVRVVELLDCIRWAPRESRFRWKHQVQRGRAPREKLDVFAVVIS